jgi:DGQHR domain-containing protein
MKSSKTVLKRRALRLDQNGKNPLYLFSLTGEELLQIADISRISRDDTGKLIGYQRPEVKKHVEDIVTYLNGESVLFPNSLILALSSRVRFVLSRGPQLDDGLVTAGVLEIPLPDPQHEKPGWIVDGQQRAMAISRSTRSKLPIPINAFVADDIELQRDQFLRVNNTKPLPRGLITELLPSVSCPLPANLQARKIPAAICDLLNSDSNSPFYGLIRRSSTPRKKGVTAVIADESVVKMIGESISSPSGCLFPFRNMSTGETDFTNILAILTAYWTAVKQTFPDAWGIPATKSRLMGGTGLRAIGRLMDRVMATIPPGDKGLLKHAKRELESVAQICRWTSGKWEDLDNLRWDELQNVPRHIKLLSNLLIRHYLHAKGSHA